MKIGFVSENNFLGKVQENATHLRTEVWWLKCLDAIHINWNKLDEFDLSDFDIVVFVLSKNNPDYMNKILLFNKNNKIKIGIMQEGPNHLWQEWEMIYQYLFWRVLDNIDFIFCHNELDKLYFEGISNRLVYILPTMIGTDYINKLPRREKVDSCIVNGTFCSWYNAGSAFLTIKDIKNIGKIYFPSMGRKKEKEDYFAQVFSSKDILFLPLMDWSRWMEVLSGMKYAINLMPTLAANSFVLNCACLKIPCIGDINADVQRTCFPELSININNTKKAKELMVRLTEDKEFYERTVNYAYEKSKEFDYLNQRPKMMKIIEEIIK